MSGKEDVDTQQMIERWDRVFHALTSEPRRQMIVALMEAPPDRWLSLPEAANPPYDLMDPEQLYVELLHHHLPLLAESGFVRWEREPLRVGRGPAFEEVGIVLEALHGYATDLPPQLVDGCQRLEEQRRRGES